MTARERPIIMSAPMVRAILAGTKTQTRRIVKPQPDWLPEVTHADTGGLDAPFVWPRGALGQQCGAPLKLAYAVGEVLWVRETFCPDWTDHVIYRADGGSARSAGYASEPRWRPAIHMPRAASRITLRVTSVRVERLQAISEEDCYAEGVLEWADAQDLRHSDGTPAKYPSARHAFQALWDSINAKRWDSTNKRAHWASSPFVWVVSFERVDRA